MMRLCLYDYVCTEACRKLRVRFQRELETQMASQYTVCRTILGWETYCLSCVMKTLHLYFVEIYLDCILPLFCFFKAMVAFKT